MNSLLYCIVLYEQQRREWLRNVFSGLFHSSRVAPRFVESISSVTLPYRTRRRFFTVLSRSMTSSHESTVISVLPLTKLCNLDIVSHECIFVCVASFGSSCLFCTMDASMVLLHDSEMSKSVSYTHLRAHET